MKRSPPKLWDITPAITPKLAVFPGDVPFSRHVSIGFPVHHLALSSITATLHLGAHADSSSHYHAQGKGVDQRDLSHYLGDCQVIQVHLERGERIGLEDFDAEIVAPRVLFHTGSFPDPEAWNGDFNSLSPELIHFLADRGVRTVGIDTPSVDPSDSKALESHQALYARDVAVLEGLVLDGVPDGLYTLVALPLKIEGADAAPVRAVLLERGAL